MLHLIYCNLPCKIIDQSEDFRKHVPIFWEVRKSKTYADYSTNSWQSSLADLRSKMSTPTLPNSTKNPTHRNLLLVQRKNPLLNPHNLCQQSKLLDLILRH